MSGLARVLAKGPEDPEARNRARSEPIYNTGAEQG